MTITSISGYLTGIDINENFVSIRSETYPINSVHPTGARFNAPGQTAYYVASGTPVAKAEKFGDPHAPIPSGEGVYTPSAGRYNMLFDLRAHLHDYPEEQTEYFATAGDGGYAKCRELRNSLEAQGCKGIIYPSQKVPGGVNISLWSVGSGQLPEDFFHRLTGFTDTSFQE